MMDHLIPSTQSDCNDEDKSPEGNCAKLNISNQLNNNKNNNYYSSSKDNDLLGLHLIEQCEVCSSVVVAATPAPATTDSCDNPIVQELHAQPVNCNALITIDPDMAREVKTKQVLHWNYRNLKELPVEVFLSTNSNVKEIYLKRNSIANLPSTIGKLQNLTNLYLNGNQLTFLPFEIGNLTNLKVLDVSQNAIEYLPGTIGNLKYLEQLIVTQNVIEALPKELGQCPRLKILEASSNQIEYIDPEIIYGLRNTLEELGLDKNQLHYLPRNVSQLKHLQYISACHCKLKYLPSVPFYRVRQIWKQRQTKFGSYLAWKNSALYDPIDTRKVNFLFDGNPNLNQIPFWILQAWGKNVTTFGCAVQAVSDDSSMSHVGPPFSTLYFNGLDYLIYIDLAMELLHMRGATQPICFKEQCLRKVSSLFQEKDEPVCKIRNANCQVTSQTNSLSITRVDKLQLPLHLKQACILGPTFQCFLCNKAIFLETWMCFLHIRSPDYPQQNVPFSEICFCSSNCFQNFSVDGISGNRISVAIGEFDIIKLYLKP